MPHGEATVPALRAMEAARCWTIEELPVLQMTSRLPRLENTPAARRFCRFYQFQQQAFLRRCQRVLLPEAQAACNAALAAGVPPPCFQTALDYTIHRNQDGICSLTTRLRENTRPGPARQLQWGDTWDLRTGRLLPVSAFFPAGSSWKRQLLNAAAAAIEARERTGTAPYWAFWPRALRRSLDPRNFYLTETALCFFYGQNVLAPALEGIPVFSLPFRPEGPLSSPVRT